MSCDQQRLHVSPNTYHPHARRKGYGRSHHSTQTTLKGVLIRSRNISNKTLRSELPENVWLSVCTGGAARLLPSPCWVRGSHPKVAMRDKRWQEPVRPQQPVPSSPGSCARAGPCAPRTPRCVRATSAFALAGPCRSIGFPPPPSPCLTWMEG